MPFQFRSNTYPPQRKSDQCSSTSAPSIPRNSPLSRSRPIQHSVHIEHRIHQRRASVHRRSVPGLSWPEAIMARRAQFVFLGVLFVTAVASAALVLADEVAPTIAEQAQATKESAKGQAEAVTESAKEHGESAKNAAKESAEAHAESTKKTATDEVAPTIKQKTDTATDASKKEAADLGSTVKSWKEWAAKRAGEWTGQGKATVGGASEFAKAHANKGAESFHSSSAKAQDSAGGMYSKWSNWAKETAGKYRSKKNPAAEAAAYINKHTNGDKEKEEL